MTHDTRIIDLARGFVDDNGKHHRTAVVRAPLIDDEIKADGAVALVGTSQTIPLAAESKSETLWNLYLVASCCVSFGEIRDVTVDHLRGLTRQDASALIRTVLGFEQDLYAQAVAQAHAEEVGEEGKDEAASPGAPTF